MKSADVDIYRSARFSRYLDGELRERYRPLRGSLEFVKTVRCARKAGTLTIPETVLDLKLDAEGNPTAVYVLYERGRHGQTALLGTAHFSREKNDPAKGKMFFYRDSGPHVTMNMS